MEIKQKKIKVEGSTVWVLSFAAPFVWQPKWVAMNSDGHPVAVDGWGTGNYKEEFILPIIAAADAAAAAGEGDPVPIWALWNIVVDLVRRVR